MRQIATTNTLAPNIWSQRAWPNSPPAAHAAACLLPLGSSTVYGILTQTKTCRTKLKLPMGRRAAASRLPCGAGAPPAPGCSPRPPAHTARPPRALACRGTCAARPECAPGHRGFGCNQVRIYSCARQQVCRRAEVYLEDLLQRAQPGLRRRHVRPTVPPQVLIVIPLVHWRALCLRRSAVLGLHIIKAGKPLCK